MRRDLPLGARVFRRPAFRALVPTVVLGVIAGSVATYRAVGNSVPSLPPISASRLLSEMARAGDTPFSGTVRLTTDLGLPNLPASTIQGANPVLLLAGTHTLQVASDGPVRQRVAFLASLSEYDVIRDGTRLWLYDSISNSVTRRQVGAGAATGIDLTPSQLAAHLLTLAGPQADVSVDGSARIAGRAAYQLTVVPHQTGTLVAEVQLAVDAATGVPLRVALYPGGTDTSAAIDATFTQISYANPPASTFAFAVPSDAHLTTVASGGSRGPGITLHAHGAHFTTVEEIDGFDVFGFSRKFLAGTAGLDPSIADLMTGSVRAFVLVVAASGTDVKGAFGGGVLYSTRILTVLVTDDNRVYAGLVSPQVLEAAASQPTAGSTP